MEAATATQPLPTIAFGSIARPSRAGTAAAVKTTVDVIGALLLLLALLPLLLVVAAAVRRDGGPVFFRQTRIGRGGRDFQMLKFRSMVVDAEAVKHHLQGNNEGSGPLFKMRHDPRITSVGRFIRKYSLDELPQLLNVVAGSMSLVGPRPHLPAEVASYSPTAYRRLAVRPGLTGLWQVSGRSDLAWDESVKLDLHYVDSWSLWLDIAILGRTFGAVLAGRGAY